MAVNIHITIIELNALHTKRQNLFQELDAVIHLDRKSGSAGMPRPISYAVFCLKKKEVFCLSPATAAALACGFLINADHAALDAIPCGPGRKRDIQRTG